MGACGCGDVPPDFQFPGPGGSTYALSVYPGCKDCETPAGVILTRYTREGALNAIEQELAGCPELPWRKVADPGKPAKSTESGEFALAVFYPAVAAQQVAEVCDLDWAYRGEVQAALYEYVTSTLQESLERARKL